MSDPLEQAFAWVEQAIAVRERCIAAVRAGDMDLAAAFAVAAADALIGRVFAVKIFEALPGIGKVRARRTMASLGLDEAATMADISVAAQSDLAVAFSAE